MIKLNDLTRKTASFRKKAPEGRYLNLKEIICLGGAGLGVSFICNFINMYVTIGQMPLIYDMGDFGTLHATIIYLVACVGALMLICLCFYTLDKKKHAEIIEELKARSINSEEIEKSAADEETAKVAKGKD